MCEHLPLFHQDGKGHGDLGLEGDGFVMCGEKRQQACHLKYSG